MENRYTDAEGRRGDRRYYGGEYRSAPEYTERHAEEYGDFDRGENYFGGSHSGYGPRMPDTPNRPTNASWRDREGYGRSDYPYSSGRARTGFGRRYGRSSDRMSRGYGGGEGYRANFGGTFGSSYPESESGYYGRSEPSSDRGWWDKTSDEISSWFGDEEAERRREMDASYGEFRGRGPRNYRRSDERIQEDVNDRLTDHDYLDASNVEVNVDNGEVFLTGTVATRYQKRLAEDVAENVSGVTNVENRLRVQTSAFGESIYGDTSSNTGLGTDTQSRAAGETR